MVNKLKKSKVEKIFTEKSIQTALFNTYYKDNSYFLKNKYIYDWETDLFYIVGLSPKGIAVEHEIKRTRSDWAKELKTKKDKHEFLQHTFVSEGENLTEDQYCPNYYIITCQEGLISKEEVENNFPYASLYWVTKEDKIKVVKKVRIHKNKLNYTDLLVRKLYFEVLNLEIMFQDFKKTFYALGTEDCEALAPLVKSFLRKLKQE